MKSYIGYIRVSTNKQGEGVSLTEQRASIEQYAARHGMRISGWYEERETAAKLGRKQFNKLLAELNSGRADGVIIHKVDRSVRHLKDWAEVGDLLDNGIDVHFAHENLDLNSRSGRLTADFLAVMAADYIRNLRDEVRKGFYGRLKQGFYPLPAPLGYLNCGGGRVKEIDPDKGPLVREMFELCGTGNYPLRVLKREVTRRGLVGKHGRPLSTSAIAHILHNPFYIGIIALSSGERFEGAHTPLIRKQLFDRVQSVLSGRATGQVRKHDFLFRRRIICVRCGRKLIGELQKGHAYYRCHTPECRGTSLREDEVQRSVGRLLTFVSFSEEELRDLRDIREEALGEEEAEFSARAARLRQAIGLCDERLIRLTDAFLDGMLSKEDVDLRKGKLLEEKRVLLDALAEDPAEQPAEALLKRLELANMAQIQFLSDEPALKREGVDLIMSNLVADGKELGFRLQFPFDILANVKNLQNSPPSRLIHRTGVFYFRENSSPSDWPRSCSKHELAWLWAQTRKHVAERGGEV